MTDPNYDVVWPKSASGVTKRPIAERITVLEGATVAFLWDYVFRGDEIFPIVEKELRNRFPAIEIVGYDEFGNTHGSDEHKMISALPDRLRTRGVDAVVSGMGC